MNCIIACKKELKMKYKIIAILFKFLSFVFFASPIVCDITVIYFQISLSIKKFGVIFTGKTIIPHWSLWLLFVNLTFILAIFCFCVYLGAKEEYLKMECAKHGK